MNNTLAIIGSGHLGQQIAHYAIADKHYKNVVFFDDFSKDRFVNKFPILGSTENVIEEFKKNTFEEILIGIGYKHLNVKKKMFERFQGSVPFGTLIHSTAWVDPCALIQEGCIVYPMCIVDANATIKSNTLLNIGCTIAHDTIIGNHCFLSPRVSIAGFVTIEELCILGINSTIIDNIYINSKVQLGGGTVVIKNLDTSGLYVGNPQRLIRKTI